MLDWLYTKLINSGFLKARLMAWARLGSIAVSSYLVTHGLATDGTAELISGAILSIVTAYLQDLDIKVVDGKIKIALHTPAPGQSALVVEEKTTTVVSTGGQPETGTHSEDNDLTGASIKTTTVEVKTLPEIPSAD